MHAPQDKDLKESLPPSSSSEDVQDEASDDDTTKLQDEPEDDNKLEANKTADENQCRLFSHIGYLLQF